MPRQKRPKGLSNQLVYEWILKNVKPGTGIFSNCLEWPTNSSYRNAPQISVNATIIPVTHFIFEHLHGRPLMMGMQINHHCDNYRCVKYGHWYEGTLKENATDWKLRHQGDTAKKWREKRGYNIIQNILNYSLIILFLF